MRKRVAAGAVLLLALAGAWALRVAERPHTVPVPVPVGGRLDLDHTPFGEAAFHADRLTADFRATLAPGRYAVGTDLTLDVPPDTTASGRLDLRVTDRGDADGRRWIDVRAEPSRVAFSNPVRAAGAAGWVADLHDLTADQTGAAVTAAPVVGRSVASWVAARVWSAPAAAEPLQTPVRDVTVTTARLELRPGGRLGWRGTPRDDASHLAVGPGSAVDVRDLAVTAAGDITAGRLDARFAAGADSVVRAAGVEVRAAGGEVTAGLTVRRSATETRVTLADAPAAVRLTAARVIPAPGLPELAAERVDVAVTHADWAQPHGGEPTATARTAVRVTGLAVAAPGLAGVRVDAVTAAVAGDGNVIQLDDVTVRVPKAAVLAAARAAVPKSLPLPDQPVADNVAELFRDVKLAGVAVEVGEPALAFDGVRVAFTARPVVRGRVTADGRQVALEAQEREVVILGRTIRSTVQVPVVRWVPQVSGPFTVPLTVSGAADVDVLPGATLAAAALRIRTTCATAEVGEPTVEGLPAPVQPLLQLAARFRDRIRVDGRSPAEFVKSRLTREDVVPLFGAAVDPRAAAALARVTATAPRLTADGADLVATASLAWSPR